MIGLSVNLAESEYRNLVRMRMLLDLVNEGTATEDHVEEYRRLYNAVISGTLHSVMLAAIDDYQAKRGKVSEVLYG
jgi:hypothetical protein